MAAGKVRSAKKRRFIHNTIVHVVLAILALIWVFPILWVILTSHILCAGGILLPFQAKIQVAEALYEHGDDPGTVSRIHVHGCRLLYLKGNRTDRRESDQSGADFVLFRRRGAWIPDRERIL